MFFLRSKALLAETQAEVAEKHRVLDYAAGFIDGQRSSMRAAGMVDDKLPAPLDLDLRALAIRHNFIVARSAE